MRLGNANLDEGPAGLLVLLLVEELDQLLRPLRELPLVVQQPQGDVVVRKGFVVLTLDLGQAHPGEGNVVLDRRVGDDPMNLEVDF